MTTPLRVHELSRRVLVFDLGGDTPATSYGANCLAYAGRDGTLVVDPLIAPAHARLVADALAARGFPPVRWAVATHHHTDHALGAGHFAAHGAEVIAHARAVALMAAQHPATVAARRADPALGPLFADAAPYLPARALEGPLSLDLGGAPVELVPVGPGHTPGDLAVVLPAEGVAATGDLVFHGYHFNYEEADPDGVRAGLDVLRALPADTYVPGHGAPGGAGLLDAQARYHAEARRLVREAPSEAAASAALRDRFPGFLLEAALPTAWACWREAAA